MLKIGVLVSGRGSNLQAILDACHERRIEAEVGLVLSNIPGAYALERASKHGIETAVLEHRAFPSRQAFDLAMVEALRSRGIELVCLAGFMRILSSSFLAAFPGKVLNIHPSLLPAFPGLHPQAQALAAGVRFTGCTVHFVDEGTDTGPILMQAVVPIFQDDSEDSLSARVLQQEHRIYPASIGLIAQGRVKLSQRQILIDGFDNTNSALVNPNI